MITQKKIADVLNVSRTTVANILNNLPNQRYSEETRALVLEKAQELGYRPNRSAQSIRRGRSNLIGVIQFGMQYEVARQTATHLGPHITEAGYDVMAIDLGWVSGSLERSVEQLIQARVEGVIVSQAIEKFGEKQLLPLQRAGIPVVTIAGNDKFDVPGVFGDVATAFADLTNHLLEQRHRRLLLLVSEYEAFSTYSRINGFTRSLTSAGGEILPSGTPFATWAASPNYTEGNCPSGLISRIDAEEKLSPYHKVRSIIASGLPLPDVILCSNDYWARQAFAALYDAGLRVPEDIALTGFDNETTCAISPYSLTTVAHPRKEECKIGFELLLKLIRKEPIESLKVSIPCELIIRRSSESPARNNRT